MVDKVVFKICNTGEKYYFEIINNNNFDVECIIQSESMFYGAFKLNKYERKTIDRKTSSDLLIKKFSKNENIQAMFYPYDSESYTFSGFEIFEVDNFYGYSSNSKTSGLKIRKIPNMPINPNVFYIKN